MKLRRQYNSGMRKYAYGDPLQVDNNTGYSFGDSQYSGNFQTGDANFQGVEQGASSSSTPSVDPTGIAISTLNNSGILKGPEGKAGGSLLSGLYGLSALGGGTAATTTGLAAGTAAATTGTAATAGSGALAGASGLAGAALLPVAGALAVNQVSKAIAGETDQDGVYKSDIKAGFGGVGNIAQTFKTGKEMADNSDRYSYLSGRSSGDVKKAANLSRIPVLGGIAGAFQQNEIRESARNKLNAIHSQVSNFQEKDSFTNSGDYARSKYGTTFATGGDISKATGYFRAGGSTHEDGGVSIGGNNEIEKNEVVFNGNVFSDRLYIE